MHYLLLTCLLALFLKADQNEPIKLCTELIPKIEDKLDLPPNVFSAVAFDAEYGYYWETGSSLKVRFIGGTPYVREKVRQYAREWCKFANVKFVFVESGNADIRIAFKRNSGSWSYIGKDAENIAQSEPTMNFGWLYDNTDENEFRRVILHEFGHALGLLHEHQHSTGGIPWDENAVYDYYAKQGWSKEYTYDNVLKRYNTSHTQYTSYDRNSIMHYSVPNQLTKGDFEVGWNSKLSDKDIQFIRKAYPGVENNPDNKEREREREEIVVTGALTVKNALSGNQVKELTYITINGVTKMFRLDTNGYTWGKVTFNLPQGAHKYEIRTTITFENQKRVWDGERYTNRRVYDVQKGFGSGTIRLGKSSCMSVYMGDNINREWFKVYLDACEN